MSYSDTLHKLAGDTEIKVPASTILLLNDEAQLLLLRTDYDEQWRLPWGEIQTQESADECVARVTTAETGFSLVDVECIGFSSKHAHNHVRKQGGNVQHLHLFVFVSTVFSGELELKPSISEAGFFDMNALPAIADPFAASVNLFQAWLPSRRFQFG